jgi:HPt (histidine-containing phosphotransfer) domain-containing protein
MDDYIAKPFALPTLASTVARWVEAGALTEIPVHAPSPTSPAPVASAPVPVPPAPANEPPVLDPAPLRQLAELLDTDTLADLVMSSVTECEARVAALEILAGTDDTDAMAKSAHTLIATAGDIGLRQMQALATRIQASARAGKADDCRPDIAALVTAQTAGLAAVAAVLKPLLKKEG